MSQPDTPADAVNWRQLALGLITTLGTLAEVAEDPELKANLDRAQQEPDRFVDIMVDSVMSLGPLGELLEDPAVVEIMVNGPNAVFVERAGTMTAARPFMDTLQLTTVLGRLVEMAGRSMADVRPLDDIWLPHGLRLRVVLPPVSAEGPYFTLKRATVERPTLDELVRNGWLSTRAELFLRACMRAGLNILVSGAARTGKTTMLNALLREIPRDERVVAVEDSREVELDVANRLYLQASTGLGPGPHVGMSHLVNMALQLRPDRIVIGQCRGEETMGLLLAMTSGYRGCLTTAFACSPTDLIAKLTFQAQLAAPNLSSDAMRRQIGAALQLIVQMERSPSGRPRVGGITSVESRRGDETLILNDVFLQVPSEGRTGQSHLVPTGLVPHFQHQLAKLGSLLPDDLYVARGIL